VPEQIVGNASIRNTDNQTKEEHMKTARWVVTGVLAVAASGVLATFGASGARADEAKATYDKTCAACHGPGGKGDGPAAKMLKPAPEAFAAGLKGKSDADIAKIIKEGGKAVGKAASMPAYGSKLSDEQISALVTYIKGLK
jgi:mono/diheme cytochrome c family protein